MGILSKKIKSAKRACVLHFFYTFARLYFT